MGAEKNTSHAFLIAAGFLAAGIFALVSMAANLKFGLSLGNTQFDWIIYGGLSLGADLMKVALPVVVLILWRKGYHALSVTGAVFWCGLVAFSLAAAVGFAASSRGETVAVHRTAIDSRKGWVAKIERVEQELGQLGVPRPSAVIKSEIDALLRTPGAGDCKVINGPVTRDICPKVDALRRERAVADRVADLEAELVAARKQLHSVPLAATVADPQSATLALIVPLPEANIRDLIAFLIAGLVETGSALGFTFMVLAKRSNPPRVTENPKRLDHATKRDVARKMHKPAKTDTHGKSVIVLDNAPSDHIARWAYARLDIPKTGRIQANAAYVDFSAWCKTEGIEPCTPQMFGRRFAGVVESMGGRKRKINGRAYYEGVMLQPADEVNAIAA